jgi:ABC-type phosphate/phosphonate transport system ATPase subunit
VNEPTSSLAPKTSVELMELLAKLGRERNISVLVDIHDVALVRHYARLNQRPAAPHSSAACRTRAD